MSKTPREVLGDLIIDIIEATPENWREVCDTVAMMKKKDQALAEIDAYYKSKVPKKKDTKHCPCGETNCDTKDVFTYETGYNQAIDDFHQSVKE